MIIRESLERIARDLLPGNYASDFSTDWILNSPGATEDSVRAVYRFLKSKGLSDSKIATQAQLLGSDPETIDRNYQKLSFSKYNYLFDNNGFHSLPA